MSDEIENKSFAGWIKSLPATRAVVVGDLIMDRYVWGDVDRISPEAPIPVLESRREETRLGGAANVAQNVTAMGGSVQVISSLGDDRAGRTLEREMASRNIGTDGLLFSDQRQTPVKTRMIAQGQQVLRTDQEDTHDITPSEQEALLRSLEDVIDDTQVVLFGDYRKGVLTDELLRHMIDLCNQHEVPTVVDPKGTDYSRYRGAYMITPNRKETENATGKTLQQEEDYQAAAEDLFDRIDVSQVVITRGSEGMSLFSEDGTSEHVPAQAIEVYDVTGAGDTVVAALGLVIGAGEPAEQAIRLANLAGARAVETLGNAVISRKDLIDFQDGQTGGRREKLVELETLLPLLERKRDGEKTVVFTNGCYDLLHSGHVRSLQFAAGQGRYLVVGINTDDSVRELKGAERPIQSLEERAKLIAALEAVDFVVPFDESTPERLIRRIVPDVLVKGADYEDEDKRVVGQDIVESNGGRVAYAPLVDGQSTTNIIQSIREGK